MSTFLLLLQKIYTYAPFFIFERGICCGCNIEVKGWPTKIWVRSDYAHFTAIYLISAHLLSSPSSDYSTLYKLGPEPSYSAFVTQIIWIKVPLGVKRFPMFKPHSGARNIWRPWIRTWNSEGNEKKNYFFLMKTTSRNSSRQRTTTIFKDSCSTEKT